jgi:nitrile hydratase subunit beta
MPVLLKDNVWPAVRTGTSARAELTSPPRFRTGDAVNARNMNPLGHTRLPRYIRGKRGIIQRNYGGFVFADTRAHGLGDHPQYVYNVRFEARELWGPEASPRDAVYIDLWESYLEPVPGR